MSKLDPHLRSVIDAYFGAMNSRNESAFTACLAKEIVFFGSMSGVQIKGIDALRGMFLALGDKFPDLMQNPLRTFGTGPEVAVLVDLAFGEDATQGMWIFRFDPAGRAERISALYDPQPFQIKKARGVLHPSLKSEEEDPPLALDPPLQAAMDQFFETFNAGDEDAHMSLFAPDVVYFGSMSGITSSGVATVRGVFRAAQTSMGVRRLTPLRTFGRRHELAVLLNFRPEDSEGPMAEGVWAFRFDEQALIARISLLWNPAFFTKKLST